MNRYLPSHLRRQLKRSARRHGRTLAQEIVVRLEHTLRSETRDASHVLVRMIVQSRELDTLIRSLLRERHALSSDRPSSEMEAPSWLECGDTMHPRLVRGEYDALSATLDARRANLSRTYFPLMKAVNRGLPASPAVVALVGL